MLAPGGHSQVFVAEKLGYRVDVRPLHSQPTRGGVAKVVEPEILDAHATARSSERHTNLLGREVREDELGGIAVWDCPQHRRSKLVQVDDSTLSVLRLGKQQAPAMKVHVKPSQAQDLGASHPC